MNTHSYYNINNKINFDSEHLVSTDAAYSVFADDLDNDENVDILIGGALRVGWYKKQANSVLFDTLKIIKKYDYEPLNCFATAADIDGDGDMDIVSGCGYEIFWHENIDGKGNFELDHAIAKPHQDVQGVLSIEVSDLDNDGDMDVISASVRDDKIAIYKNVDGKGNFGPQTILTTSANWANAVFSIDIDKDGDLDILSASHSEIAWFENEDSKGQFGKLRKISMKARNSLGVFSADFDGDGDNDVLSNSSGGELGDCVVWYENIDGKGTFSSEKVIESNMDRPTSVFAVDIDNDGDIDALSAELYRAKISWYENIDGKANWSDEKRVSYTATSPRNIYVADLDNDNDYDVLYAGAQIVWYENSLIKTTIKEKHFFPKDNFELKQNYPNPFNNTTIIEYQLPKTSQVSLKIFNSSGQLIHTLVNEIQNIGNYQISWDGKNITSGIYIYQISTSYFTKNKKMILLR